MSMATRTRKSSGKAGPTKGSNDPAPKPPQAPANGNGAAPPAAANGNGNGHGNGVATAAEARRIATELGSALLVASRLETARHCDDVELIAAAIADHLGLPAAEQDDVRAGARLHDIGKASIPSALLEKPAPLTEAEWAVMRTHSIIGDEILSSVSELEGIAQLVRHSHERWDGVGYPDGLAREDIPLGSRIIFCADAFHAIRSDRPYRTGVPAPQALAEVKRCAGTQFDPEVVAAFEQVVGELRLVPRTAARTKRASRLAALLLTLAVGVGGSAVATSDLLGDPDPSPVSPPRFLDCGSLYCQPIDGPLSVRLGAVIGGPLGGVGKSDGTSPAGETGTKPIGQDGGPNGTSVSGPTESADPTPGGPGAIGGDDSPAGGGSEPAAGPGPGQGAEDPRAAPPRSSQSPTRTRTRTRPETDGPPRPPGLRTHRPPGTAARTAADPRPAAPRRGTAATPPATTSRPRTRERPLSAARARARL